MIPASLDSGHRLIADTLAAFRAGPALGSVALRPAPRARVPLYIGIAGSKRSGKDTLANGLASALSLPCDSFAAPLVTARDKWGVECAINGCCCGLRSV